MKTELLDAMQLVAWIKWRQDMEASDNETVARAMLRLGPTFGKLSDVIEVAAERLAPGVIARMADAEKGADMACIVCGKPVSPSSPHYANGYDERNQIATSNCCDGRSLAQVSNMPADPTNAEDESCEGYRVDPSHGTTGCLPNAKGQPAATEPAKHDRRGPLGCADLLDANNLPERQDEV
ncbi:MAG: hypothetical protein RL513_1364 [Pseudomonadota bacterium]|jgi:hypothetical protein